MVKCLFRVALQLSVALFALPALAAAQDLLLEAEVEPAEVHAQTQAIYRLRFFQGVDVRDLKITGPSAALADFRQIGEERIHEMLRAGRRYRVHERRYAVFPFASGRLEIAGAHAEGRIAVSAGKSADGLRLVRLEAAPQTLIVLPVPAGSGVPARSMQLSETWSMPLSGEARAGGVEQRHIRIEALGVDAGQLPELDFTAPGMTVHAEPARLENHFRADLNVASREQVFNVVALRAGDLVVPELHVRWWDVDAGAPATARLPSRTVHVAADASVADRERPVPLTAPPYLIMLLAGMLGATAVLVWRRRISLRSAWRLHRACRSGSPDAVRDGLLAWAAILWPQCAPPTLGALAEGLDDLAARRALGDLDRLIYGRSGGLCDPDELGDLVRQIKRGFSYPS